MSQHIDPPMMQASVVDNLTTNDGTKALSAAQGYALNGNKVNTFTADAITANDVTSFLSAVIDLINTKDAGLYVFEVGWTSHSRYLVNAFKASTTRIIFSAFGQIQNDTNAYYVSLEGTTRYYRKVVASNV